MELLEFLKSSVVRQLVIQLVFTIMGCVSFNSNKIQKKELANNSRKLKKQDNRQRQIFQTSNLSVPKRF